VDEISGDEPTEEPSMRATYDLSIFRNVAPKDETIDDTPEEIPGAVEDTSDSVTASDVSEIVDTFDTRQFLMALLAKRDMTGA
jgi:hypothetical protein